MIGRARVWLPLACLGLLGIAGVACAQDYPKYAEYDWTGLPPNINSAYGSEIDNLYYLIFWVTAAMFLLTEGGLIYFMVRYRRREGGKSRYVHGSNRAELIWTVIPGVMLFGLALIQSSTWSKVRTEFPRGGDVVRVQVFAQQFEWSFRYPGRDNEFGTEDDIVTTKVAHLPANREVVMEISAKDVIHSFFLPHARVKQDAVPGIRTKVWFVLDHHAVWFPEGEKKGETVLVTADQLKKHNIVVDTDVEAFFLNEEKIDKTGVKNYWWEGFMEPDYEVSMLKGGELTRAPVKEKEAFLHPIEVACAELCGMNHFTMRGLVYVHTDESYEAWMEKKMKEKEEAMKAGTPESQMYFRWRNIWDKQFEGWSLDR